MNSMREYCDSEDFARLGSFLFPGGIVKTPKTSITSHKQLAEQISGVKQSHRQTQSDRSSSPKDSDSPKLDGIPKSSTILKKRSMLPPVLVARELANESVKQDPIEEKMWNLVNAANPSLCQFAQEHKMDLDSVIIYGTLLNEMKIKPGVLDEFLNNHHNLNVTDSHEAVIQGYKKIKKENPEYWTTLLLEMFKELDGQGNGATTRTALTNINGTQIGLLHDQIAVEKNDKFKLLIVIGVKFVVILAGIAWGMYGQISGTANPCTHAPTYMPTNSPTYSPTFSPTYNPTQSPI